MVAWVVGGGTGCRAHRGVVGAVRELGGDSAVGVEGEVVGVVVDRGGVLGDGVAGVVGGEGEVLLGLDLVVACRGGGWGVVSFERNCG